jgi:hypothetical protein
MKDLLLYTVVPVILAVLGTMRFTGKWSFMPAVLAIARNILTNPKSLTTDPAKAIREALVLAHWHDVVEPAYDALEKEIAAGKLKVRSPSMVDELLSGMDVEVIEPDPEPEDFKPVFPDRGRK